jgi:1,4-alpha-glucan branching enzyme
MIRLITLTTAGHGYLNFMGNEFGHPEWIDFPREGNHWSYHYARRQWNLRDDPNLRYRFLAEFDKAMMGLCRDHKLIETPGPHFLHEHISDQVLAFERAGLVFIFNFNPAKSFTDYPIPVPPGDYRLLVDSDATGFGGFGRLAPWGEYGGTKGSILTYLPSRTVLVLSTRPKAP